MGRRVWVEDVNGEEGVGRKEENVGGGLKWKREGVWE